MLNFFLGAGAMATVVLAALGLGRWFSRRVRLVTKVRTVAFQMPSDFGKTGEELSPAGLASCRRFMSIHVENRGQKAAESVVVRLPDAEWVEIAGPDDGVRVVTAPVIEVGRLRPDEEARVSAWLRWPFSEEVTVVHEGGRARVIV